MNTHVSPFEYLVKYFNNKFVDHSIKEKLPTCTANKKENEFSINEYIKLKTSYGSASYWKNIYYLDPDLDSDYDTDKNFPYIEEDHSSKKRKFYSVRFDFRVTPMMVMTMLRMFMLDFDIKDYNIIDKREMIEKIFIVLKNINNALYEKGFPLFIWHIAESDRGFHVFLLNHEIDIWDDNIRLFMVQICTDLQYAAFANLNAYSTRLTKKKGYPDDFVARKWNDQPFFYDDTKTSLDTINISILKAVIYKYNLIKYFSEFKINYLDYIYNNVLSNLKHKNIMVTKMRNHFSIMEKYVGEKVDEIIKNDSLTIIGLNKCLQIIHPNIYVFFEEIKNIVEPKSNVINLLNDISIILQQKVIIDKLLNM